MIRTIRTQLLLVNTAVLALIFTIMSIYLVSKNTAALRMTVRNEVQSFATLATPPIGNAYTIYGESGTDRVQETIKSYLDVNNTIVNASIVNLEGEELFSYAKGDGFKVSAASASTFKTIYDMNNKELAHVIAPYFGASGAHSYSIVYTVSNDQINSLIRSQTVSLVIFSILSLILTTLATYAAINRFILRPIRAVSSQADVISGGNLEQKITVTGNNEIAALGRAIDSMAESLKTSIAKLQEVDKIKSEFMAITSHNLRTPLTIMNSYLENLDLFNSVDELKSAIRRIADGVKRLSGFAEDVLTISRFELGEQDLTHERVAIGDLMRRIASESASAAELRGISLSSDIKTNAEVLASPPYLRSAVWNLLDNAVKFTPKGGTITLGAVERNGFVDLSVTDTGVGIDPEEIPKLYTKFHRGTSVETYDYEGTGIGLYATKMIVEQQGGTIAVKSKKGEGSTFTISLPIAQDKP